MADRAYSDAEIDAAVALLQDAERLRDAQELVARAAPQLQRVLNTALSQGGWFGDIHDQAVQAVAREEDLSQRAVAISTLVAEETRLGMLVGVAVGFELARTLEADTSKGE
ncbi:hypothetical protein [Conexibacter sp. CPCC 206217]|uniref:hypothetical protein n=1 Tax=Conexibacter sp. CPCC 206217 TaxID=3064574 RepID=UPI0027242EA1|nr:hypothetical protein [Conexibacter sp. CPCC 206217]MDO8209771.1 hypothetical protein [Conexibacter sp. CPCC 206217]